MEQAIQQKTFELERFIGFKTERRLIRLEQEEPHDEVFSYNLCLRFYDDQEGLQKAIDDTNSLLRLLIMSARSSGDSGLIKRISNLYSLIGNMHYLKEEYDLSAGYFMKSLSGNKEDITAWIELLFSIRAIGKFGLFEEAIFNLDKLVKTWKQDPEQTLSQKKVVEIINKLSSE